MKPPLGLTPKEIHHENVRLKRIIEIVEAIERYLDASIPIPTPWIEEYNTLVSELPNCTLHSVTNDDTMKINNQVIG